MSIPGSSPFPAVFDSISGALLGNPRGVAAVSIGLAGAIALADYVTGFETEPAVLYLLPVHSA